MVALVVVDHHRADYFQNDYDLLLSDADPDGYLSALIYALGKGSRSIQYKCYRVPLTKEVIDIFHNNGIKTII